MNAKAVLLAILLPAPAFAQGFAGLANDAEGFTLPRPDPVFDFPADHAAHPDFRIEWWYVTANLSDAEGARYGAQWTLFRSALAPGDADGWTSPQIWFAHAAITTADAQHVAERFARGGIGQAGVEAVPFEAWIDDWAMRSHGGGGALEHLTVTAQGAEFGYRLALDADGPLVLQGERGYSVKSERGQASYYYSQPFYHASGTLELPGGPVEVTGKAWLDREWSSQPLADSQTGWDWFSLHFDGGEKLMVYRLRDSAAADYTPGTHVAADGTARSIPDGQITLDARGTTDVADREIPTAWRLRWPEGGIDITTRALNPRSWMDTALPYWEGPIGVSGSHTGVGYLEMTGYE